MPNLKEETMKILDSYSKTFDDIKFIVSMGKMIPKHVFLKIADREYDSITSSVNASLKLVGSDFWIERAIYDHSGSECWEFKTPPTQPEADPERLVLYEDMVWG